MAKDKNVITIIPAATTLNTRTYAGLIGINECRWRQNFEIAPVRNFARARLFSNFKLQGVDLASIDGESKILNLISLPRNSGGSDLVAITTQKIYKLKGNRWQEIYSFGNPINNAFDFAQFGNGSAVLTNLIRGVYYLNLLSENAFSKISEVAQSPVSISGAKRVCVWRQVVFLGDIIMDGTRVTNRVIWSGYNNPESWVPATDSIAGYQDLDLGETIKAFVPTSDYLLIFTDRSIWMVVHVGGDSVFNFRQLYRDNSGAGQCLYYDKSIAMFGHVIYFLSRNHIHTYTIGSVSPQIVDQLDKQASKMLQDCESASIDSVIASVNPITNEIFFSYKQRIGGHYNTFVLNAVTGQGYYYESGSADNGFSAMCLYNGGSRITTEELKAILCTSKISYTDALNSEICSVVYTMPDGTRLTLGSATISDFCKDYQPQIKYLGVHSADNRIKSLGETFEMELGNNLGYKSDYILGPYDLGAPNREKIITKVEIEMSVAEEEIAPPVLVLQLGRSNQSIDPLNYLNAEYTPIDWVVLKSRATSGFKQNNGSIPANAFVAADGTAIRNTLLRGLNKQKYSELKLKPSLRFIFPSYLTGNYFYLRLIVEGIGGNYKIEKILINYAV